MRSALTKQMHNRAMSGFGRFKNIDVMIEPKPKESEKQLSKDREMWEKRNPIGVIKDGKVVRVQVHPCSECGREIRNTEAWWQACQMRD